MGWLQGHLGSDARGGRIEGVPCVMGTQGELPLSQPQCCPPQPVLVLGHFPRAVLPPHGSGAVLQHQRALAPAVGKGLSRMGSLGLRGGGGASGRGHPGICAPTQQHCSINTNDPPPSPVPHTLLHPTPQCAPPPFPHTSLHVCTQLGLSQASPPQLCPPQEKGPDTADNLYIIYIFTL